MPRNLNKAALGIVKEYPEEPGASNRLRNACDNGCWFSGVSCSALCELLQCKQIWLIRAILG